MKTLKTLSHLLFFALILTSCDEIDELTEIDVNANTSATIEVNIPGDIENPFPINESVVINIAENQDISDNFDKIESISFNTFRYEILNYQGSEDNALTNVKLDFNTVEVELPDILLNTANNPVQLSGTITDTEILNDIEIILLNRPDLTATLMATIADTPVTFNVKITLDFTATVDAL